MYSNLFRRIPRRSLIKIDRKNFHNRPNETYNAIKRTLLTSFKDRNTIFSLKAFTVPFAGSLALIWIKARCDQNPEKDHLQLLDAIRNRDMVAIKSLINKGADVNKIHPLGWTALHVAVVNKNVKVVELILNKKAHIHHGDDYTNHTRMASEKNMEPDKVKATREKEFSDQIKRESTYQGCTALHYAVMVDDNAIIEALLKAGADPTIRNKMDKKPSDYTKDNTIKEMLNTVENQLIKEKEAREAEEEKNYPLELKLSKQIIGQEGAISTVAAALRRRKNGWYKIDRPLVLLFLGSSGIGKTELAKHVAVYLHKENKKDFIRVDMSEYQEKHSVAKLIGSPPGYIGHTDGGQLTKLLEENPGAVVLFDEIDKAHPDVLTVMLQLFDEGRLTDGIGKTITCKDAVFILTSNLASEEIAEHAEQLRKEAAERKEKRDRKLEDILFGGDIEHGQLISKRTLNKIPATAQEEITISRKFKNEVVRPILKKRFERDEFLGRIHEVVYFLPFTESEKKKLVKKELKYWGNQAMEKHGFRLIWENKVVRVLADGYNALEGARSIDHEVERTVVSKLAEADEKGLLTNCQCVYVAFTSSPANIGVSSPTEQPDTYKNDNSIYLTVVSKQNNERMILTRFN